MVTVENRLVLMLINQGVDPSDIVKEANLRTDLGLDSMTLYNLLLDVESEFDISIPDHEYEKIITFQDAVSYLQVKLFNIDGWGFSDPSSPIEIEQVNIPPSSSPQSYGFQSFEFFDFSNRTGHSVSVGSGSNFVYNYRNTIADEDEPEDCNDPMKPPYLTCDQWLLMNGHGFITWVRDQSSYRVYKPNSWLDSEALNNGMSVVGYISDRLQFILDNIKSDQVKNIGRAIRATGLVGGLFSGCKLIVAVADGNITTRDVLNGVSFALTVVTLFPGVGTTVGLGGQILLSTGSLMFGIVSDQVDDTELIDFSTR